MTRDHHLEVDRRHRAERAARLGRIKRWLKPLPRRSNVSRYPIIRHFADAARRNPQLWSFQSASVRRAIYLGSIIAFLPVYGLHLLLAFGAAIVVRANLAVTCAFLLITNPLSAGPIYYAAYRVGMWLIHTFEAGEGRDALGTRFNALFLGGLIFALGVAVVADLAYGLAVWEAGRLRQRHAEARERAAAAGVGLPHDPVTPEAPPPSE
jgi:hypothetical protein